MSNKKKNGSHNKQRTWKRFKVIFFYQGKFHEKIVRGDSVESVRKSYMYGYREVTVELIG